MLFQEIKPSAALKPFVKCFYFYDSGPLDAFSDTVYPSGNMEMVFNLGNGHWQFHKNNDFYTTAPVELWGQVTKPLAVKSTGANTMLGIRFYSHSMAYFSEENMKALNNDTIDAADLFGPTLRTLHTQLLDTTDLRTRITLLEQYLLARLQVSTRRQAKLKFVGEIVNSLKYNFSTERIAAVSSRNNITPRYLAMLFSEYTGLQPKLLCKINRFNYSLNLIQSQEQDLTSIAYDAGYFDQSHFIKEFKLFTGLTPHTFTTNASALNLALAEEGKWSVG
jgi:AraC-like DNA-binding protein